MSIRALLPAHIVERLYAASLLQFADCVSERNIGRPVGIMQMIEKWLAWEREYARRGFRTVQLEDAVDSVIEEKSLTGLLGQKLLRGEQPILHAEYVKSIGLEDKPFKTIDSYFG